MYRVCKVPFGAEGLPCTFFGWAGKVSLGVPLPLRPRLVGVRGQVGRVMYCLVLLYTYVRLRTRACSRLVAYTLSTTGGSDLAGSRVLFGRTLGVSPTGVHGTLLFAGLKAIRQELKGVSSTVSSCALSLGVAPCSIIALLGHTSLCLRGGLFSETCISCYGIVSVSGAGGRTLLFQTCVCVRHESCGKTEVSCGALLRRRPKGGATHLNETLLGRGRLGCHRSLRSFGGLISSGPESISCLGTHTALTMRVGAPSLTLLSLRRTTGLTPSSTRVCIVYNRVCLDRGGGERTCITFRGTVRLKIPQPRLRSGLGTDGWGCRRSCYRAVVVLLRRTISG